MFSRPVTILRFDGPRFEDHGLDVDVLPEIIAYKRLLQETAKEIWRRANPDRQRLPRHFEASISLKFFSLQAGSTAIPLFRTPSDSVAQIPLLLHDEVDRAAVLLEETIRTADLTDAVPRDLPRAIIPLFEQLGSTLRPDERLFVRAGDSAGAPALFDQRVKQNILRWAERIYPDVVEIWGEVRSTDLDGLRFTLRLDDGRKLPARFKPEHEQIVLDALGEHARVRLKVKGTGAFDPISGSLSEVVSVDHIEIVDVEPSQVAVAPIWDRLAALGSSVPDAAWRDIPRDLSANVDAYLYGKREPH